MKKTLRILSLLMALMLVLAVFAGCQINGNDATTTTPEELEDGKVTVYWMQGQKELKQVRVEIGTKVSEWTPTVEGKTFKGWYSDPGCTKEFDFTQEITKDTEIYASFKTTSGGVVEEEPTEAPAWYLVGSGLGSLSVSNWNEKNYSLPMEDQGDGTYTITVDLYAGDMFQICTGGSWSGQRGLGCMVGVQFVEGSNESQGEVRDENGNVVFVGDGGAYGNPFEAWDITLVEGQDGKYEITFDEVESKITFKFISKLDPKDPSDVVPSDNTYTVAGTAGLCRTEWDVSNTENDMTLENGVFVKTYDNVMSGEHEFKVALNHDWSVSYGNPDNSNIVINVPNDGTTVVITFNPAAGSITVKDGEGNDLYATPSTPEIGNDATYTVAGTSGLCRTEWDVGNTANDMTLVNGVYTITYENVAAGTHSFKVAVNHSWDHAYGDPNNSDYNNIVINLSTASSVTITFDPSTATVTATDGEGNVLFGSSEPSDTPTVGEPASVVYLVPGSWNGLCAAWCWVFGSEGSWVTLTDKDNDGVYECNVPAGCDMIVFANFGDAMEADWDYKVAQTSDMKIPAAPDVYYHADTATWSSK